MYAARQEYSSFDVVVCWVYDVTNKSLVVHDAQAIFGYSLPRGHMRMPPSGDWVFFDTVTEALVWVMARMSNKVAGLQSEIARIEQNLEPVEEMLKLDDLEDRVAEAVAKRANLIKRDLGYET
jgi:hypothetical protein